MPMTSIDAFAVERLGSRWAVISGGAIFAYASRRQDAIRLAAAAGKVLEETAVARASDKSRRN